MQEKCARCAEDIWHGWLCQHWTYCLTHPPSGNPSGTQQGGKLNGLQHLIRYHRISGKIFG